MMTSRTRRLSVPHPEVFAPTDQRTGSAQITSAICTSVALPAYECVTGLLQLPFPREQCPRAMSSDAAGSRTFRHQRDKLMEHHAA